MKIWLVKAGEPLPIDNDKPRLLRTGMMYEDLCRDHQVTWLTEAFDHQKKRFRYQEDTEIDTGDQAKIVLFKTLGYKRNISPGRMLDDLHLAKKIGGYFKKNERPDFVICSYPMIATAYVVVKHCKRLGIPVIVDVRDLWPDIFPLATTGVVRLAGNVACKLLSPMVRYIFQNATSVIGITEGIVDWACRKGDREKTFKDRAFPLSSIIQPSTDDCDKEMDQFWECKGITKADTLVSYVGLINNKVDLRTVLRGFLEANLGASVKLVVAGEGDDLEQLQAEFSGIETIIFSGWLNKYQIASLLYMSQLGLVPYKTRLDFSLSIPNKVIEYMAYGLPIVAALDGEITTLIDRYDCGYRYLENDSRSFARVISNAVYKKDQRKNRREKVKNVYHEFFDGPKVFGELRGYIESYCS